MVGIPCVRCRIIFKDSRGLSAHKNKVNGCGGCSKVVKQALMRSQQLDAHSTERKAAKIQRIDSIDAEGERESLREALNMV